MGKVIVVTSGKGGVGKTTSAAAIGTGLALRGKKTVVIDFDVGLRNLDLVMGCERRVVFDFVNVINDGIRLNQALIKDKRVDGLFVLPTSQTKDRDALSLEGVGKTIDELREDFDYVICDSPAGIEGDEGAMIFCDQLEAQLLSIAGVHLVNEEIDPKLLGRRARVRLERERLVVQPVG